MQTQGEVRTATAETGRSVLISGASFAGLSTAYWMNKLGYKVTVVEIAKGLKKGGTPVDIEGNTIEIVKRMGLFEAIHANSLPARVTEFKNSDDVTEGIFAEQVQNIGRYEIDRDVLLDILFDAVSPDVELVFDNSIAELEETAEYVSASFADGSRRQFSLALGCDGTHSAVRKMWFGQEPAFVHFLQHYFSITIVDKVLIDRNKTHIYNTPGKSIMLNSYEDKTDIVFCFHSDEEMPYDRRDEVQQRRIILEKFAETGWRAPQLLAEIHNSEDFYFDKMCQIKMPSWTKGRVALVGDAGYCASPAAGLGGSLAIVGAAALADAFQKAGGDFERAFQEYEKSLRPFVDEVQAQAVNFGLEMFAPRTQDAIRERNRQFAA